MKNLRILFSMYLFVFYSYSLDSCLEISTFKKIISIQYNATYRDRAKNICLSTDPSHIDESRDENNQIKERETKFSVLLKIPRHGYVQHRSSKKIQQYNLRDIGHLTLLEKTEPALYETSVFLDNISIHKEHRGGGNGTQTINELFELLDRLRAKSSFYNQLSLRCADIDEGEETVLIPTRLKWYLNLGFKITEQTKKFMQFLSLSYFVQKMTPGTLRNYIRDYRLGDHTTLPRPQLEQILIQLRSQNWDCYDPDIYQQMAETSGTVCAEQILDRAFYDGIMEDAAYPNLVKYLYFLTCNLAERQENITMRQELLQFRAAQYAEQGTAFNPECLNIVCCAGYDIFESQVPLNQYIIDLLKQPSTTRLTRKRCASAAGLMTSCGQLPIKRPSLSYDD